MTQPWRLLRVGILVGAGYGLLEGALSAGLSYVPGTLSWESANAPQALLAAPIFYALAYGVAGALVALVAARWPSLPWSRLLVTALAGLSGCLLAGQLGHYFGAVTTLVLGLGIATMAWRADWGGASAHSRLTTPLGTALLVLGAPIPGLVLVALLARAERQREAALPAAPAGAPNILLLVLDTQRADHLSAYGYERPTTPHLDRLAAEGVLYDLAISGAPTTLPSHATLLTGRRVSEHHAGEESTKHLAETYPTLAEVLAGQGWRTGGFIANTYWTGRHTGLNRGFLHYDDFYGNLGDAVARTALGRRISYTILPRLGAIDIPGRKRAGTVNREFLRWAERDSTRPFFGFLNFFDVHSPYLPPPSTAGRFSGGRRSGSRPSRIEIGAWGEHDHLPDSAQLARWRDAYDESLLALDAEVGGLLDSLRAHGRLDRTIVVVAGDHGESFGSHGLVHHGGGLYQNQVRVPLIIRYPSLIPAGSRVRTPVSLADLAITLTRFAGVPDGGLGGMPFDWKDATEDGRVVVSEAPFVEGNPVAWPTGQGWEEAVFRGPWHLILRQGGRVELFDLATDPHERVDRASDTTAVALRTELLALLAKELPVPPAPSLGDHPETATPPAKPGSAHRPASR